MLHNMSVPHRTAIEHAAPPGARRCRGLVVRWNLPPRDARPQCILSVLDGSSWTGSPKAAGAELRHRIQEHAQTLPWPGALLVTDQADPNDPQCNDLLTICTVLSKSSESVYLRDKEPNLERLRAKLRAVLQIPLNWSPR
jgi:hypothetical protein